PGVEQGYMPPRAGWERVADIFSRATGLLLQTRLVVGMRPWLTEVPSQVDRLTLEPASGPSPPPHDCGGPSPALPTIHRGESRETGDSSPGHLPARKTASTTDRGLPDRLPDGKRRGRRLKRKKQYGCHTARNRQAEIRGGARAAV